MFYKLKVVVLCVIGGLFLITSLANAQELRAVRIENVSCISSPIVKDVLYKKAGEKLHFIGVFHNNKTLLNFFVNYDTDTWSFVAVNMDGTSCLFFYGDGFRLNLSTGD